MNTEHFIPEWIVNDNGELGVKVGDRFFFLYKGESFEYKDATHDDGTPMRYRVVGKREFGETCWPLKWVKAGRRPKGLYTDNLTYVQGLSFGKPGNEDWRDLPSVEEEASIKDDDENDFDEYINKNFDGEPPEPRYCDGELLHPKFW